MGQWIVLGVGVPVVAGPRRRLGPVAVGRHRDRPLVICASCCRLPGQTWCPRRARSSSVSSSRWSIDAVGQSWRRSRSSTASSRRRWSPSAASARSDGAPFGRLTDKRRCGSIRAGAARTGRGRRGDACRTRNGRSARSPTRRWARTTSSSGGSGATPAFWSLWSLGVAAVISGDFYGLELRPRRRGVRRSADRHRSSSRSCTTGCASASPRCPRRCRTPAARTRSHARRWARGADSSPDSPRTWSTSSRRPSSSARWAFLMHDIMAGLLDLAGEPWWNSHVTWWAVFYVIFVGLNIVGIEATMRFTVVINILALGDPGVLLHRRARVGRFRLPRC